MLSRRLLFAFAVGAFLAQMPMVFAAESDYVRDMQEQAIRHNHADWGHWGVNPKVYTGWKTHSNRLIPLYLFGGSLDAVKGEHSAYRSEDRLRELYGQVPRKTLNPTAEYFDQTDIFRLQQAAAVAGKKHIVLFIFDGMDWQTTWAASIYQHRRVAYREGRGEGLWFQDYRGAPTDFGYFVSSPHNAGTKFDVNTQTVQNPGGNVRGGYDPQRGGPYPWSTASELPYPISQGSAPLHAYTDSSASMTSMCTGIKTYNDAVCVDPVGRPVETIAQKLQQQGYSIGVLTSVPISHATPACTYAANVSRDDFQDLTRDLVGLPSVSHPGTALPGVDVLLGGGWHEDAPTDSGQGKNFVPGNRYLTAADRDQIDAAKGGKYVIAERTPNRAGAEVLKEGTVAAVKDHHRLLGMFGVSIGHLPFRTADGDFKPTIGAARLAQTYSEADLKENPTLADFTRSALAVLETNPKGFWLMVEAGDVDWANHDDNIDSSIGAVESGDEAFHAITDWAEKNDRWRDTLVIVTADHGHYFFLDKPEALAGPDASSDAATAKPEKSDK